MFRIRIKPPRFWGFQSIPIQRNKQNWIVKYVTTIVLHTATGKPTKRYEDVNHGQSHDGRIQEEPVDTSDVGSSRWGGGFHHEVELLVFGLGFFWISMELAMNQKWSTQKWMVSLLKMTISMGAWHKNFDPYPCPIVGLDPDGIFTTFYITLKSEVEVPSVSSEISPLWMWSRWVLFVPGHGSWERILKSQPLWGQGSAHGVALLVWRWSNCHMYRKISL